MREREREKESRRWVEEGQVGEIKGERMKDRIGKKKREIRWIIAEVRKKEQARDKVKVKLRDKENERMRQGKASRNREKPMKSKRDSGWERERVLVYPNPH